MGNITAKLVKDLRDKTGAGMMDCKKALNETDGNVEKAVEWLRKKGIATRLLELVKNTSKLKTLSKNCQIAIDKLNNNQVSKDLINIYA